MRHGRTWSFAAKFIRYECALPNARGAHSGIFAAANGLAADGRLSAEDWSYWRAANDWFDAAYPNPAVADPTLFDKAIHAHVTCWFKASAEHLLERIPAHLELLDRYGVQWRRVTTSERDNVLYEDDVQVVIAHRE